MVKSRASYLGSRTALFVLYFLCLFSILLLDGCSSTKGRPDGPPPFYVDETRIPDAIPKSEKLAKYGNMNSYRVFGKTYYPLKSAKNFQETGRASWYGFKWHKLRTSSGEPYSVTGMTAAHRTLPLPTYVEVTNLKNNRKVIVKVNDRGPFAGNRIIDLSYVAAKKLGMIGHGTTEVHIAAIDPEQAQERHALFAENTPRRRSATVLEEDPLAAVSATTERPRSYRKERSIGYLQVGAFRNRMLAENLKRRVSKVISSPVQISQSASSKKGLYRVKIGPLKDVATANTISKKLQAIGLKTERIRV